MIDTPAVVFSAEPQAAFWRDPATYDRWLQTALIDPLEEAARHIGHVPRALQIASLQQLHWYFTVDLRERAPTVILSAAQAPAFHERVRQIMQHIEADVLEAVELQHVSVEVRHALLSYRGPVLQSTVTLDAYDHTQGLVRLSYYVHGGPPSETFLIDGMATRPAYAKYRACRYFDRTLLHQRIVWLPVASAAKLQVMLAGVDVPVALWPQPFPSRSLRESSAKCLAATALLPAARTTYPPGKGGQQPLPPGWAGWKVRLLCALAHLPLVRQRFAKAWVFMDRKEDADDNAEHLYRWVRQHHPEINAWFLLDRSSADWDRLAAEGFRLVPPGLTRQLLVLNCKHIISSHAEYVFGGFDRRLYGSAMQWRYTFLTHGVAMNDVSHWLGSCEFDGLITSSPAEHESIVGDDTAYPYTEREVHRTGLPRHDRLLQIAQRVPAAEVNALLIMPTWRADLIDGRITSHSVGQQMLAFASSDYASHWRRLLRNEELRDLTVQHGQRLVFMPHPNAVRYLDAFDLPAHVELATKASVSMQQVFARAAGFITDYTSVAFEMAFLRRPVFYFQFDRERFYSGGHNWRKGYFDYERDGFGPVALTEEDLLVRLRGYFLGQAQAEPEYLARMTRAMPDRDDQACRRVFESICGLSQRVVGDR